MAVSNSTITTIVWGFNNQSAKNAILELKKRKIIKIPAWFGTAPECSHDMIDFFTGNYCHEKYQGYGECDYQTIFNTTIHQFMDLMSRHVFYNEKEFYDLLNIYNELYDLFSYILFKHKVELVLFSSLPHEGPDLILYQLAKEKKIPIIMFYQSIFPGKIFYIFDLDDFGTFTQIPKIGSNNQITLVRNHRTEHVNMESQHITNIPFSLNSGSMTSLLQVIVRPDLLTKVRDFRKRNVERNNESEFQFDKNSGVCTRGFNYLERQISRFKRHLLAKKWYSAAVWECADLECAFVYFPLHLQPELTTSILGSIYVDQILAVERLSKILPENWFIFVKENPKQTELMRGRWFFSRLTALENVRLLDPGIDTYILMEKCRFVATITGTAGWEAISGGKNALVFGKPWYKGLPGVFTYENSIKIEDIINYRINHNELIEAVNNLLDKTVDGIIDEDYTSLLKDYNSEKNSIIIADFIEYILTRVIP